MRLLYILLVVNLVSISAIHLSNAHCLNNQIAIIKLFSTREAMLLEKNKSVEIEQNSGLTKNRNSLLDNIHDNSLHRDSSLERIATTMIDSDNICAIALLLFNLVCVVFCVRALKRKGVTH